MGPFDRCLACPEPRDGNRLRCAKHHNALITGAAVAKERAKERAKKGGRKKRRKVEQAA